MPVKYTRELPASLAAESSSVDETMHKLGVPMSRGARSYPIRRLRHYDIDVSHFDQGCRAYRQRQYSMEAPTEAAAATATLDEMLVELGRPELCEDCGTGPEWRGRPMTLEVDHINGDWSDDRPNNLRLLCPNCHSVTDTYCGRNKNKRKAPHGIAVFPAEAKP